jgi:hypothetical protein
MKKLKNIIKNIAEWIAILVIIFLGVVGASAGTDKTNQQIVSKYEIKSEIINFDYTKIGYPFSDVKIGGDFSVKDNITIPRKLATNNVKVSNEDIRFNSIVSGFLLVIEIFFLCVFIVLFMLFADWIMKF